MNRYEMFSVLLNVMDSLRQAGSWCGETHVQKAAYLLKHFSGVELPQEFVLYKHGPYSFDLSNDLGTMLAYGLIELESKGKYGPTIIPTALGQKLMREKRITPQRKRRIQFIASKFAGKGVSDLERLATAYFLTCQRPIRQRTDVKGRAEELVSIKPHVSLAAAISAVKEVDSWRDLSSH